MAKTDDGQLCGDDNTYAEIDLIDDLLDYGVITGQCSMDEAMMFRLVLPLVYR